MALSRHVGIIGAGNISETHMRAVQAIDGLQVAAVFGRNPEKVESLARQSDARAYLDFEAFLHHRPMDLVTIGSPSSLHAEQGVAAAQQGIHVLVEKPIDISTDRADRLIAECRESGVKLGVFFQDRVSDGPRQLKGLLEDGTLGQPLLLTAHVKWYRPPEYYSDSDWRGTWAFDGGGTVINQAIHTLDLMLWLLGDVRQVFAYAKTQAHRIETEDTAVAAMEFVNGALATFEATTAAFPGQPRRLYLSGSKGTAFLEHDQLVEVSGQDTAQSLSETRSLSESSPVVSDVTGHRQILEDFVSAIREDRRPICDGVEGRRSVGLVEAIYSSSRTGRPVEPTSG
jgi:predicted dehydrogenase